MISNHDHHVGIKSWWILSRVDTQLNDKKGFKHFDQDKDIFFSFLFFLLHLENLRTFKTKE